MTKADKPKNIPQVPGVYFWRDARRRPLYIGRATNLRQRLSQYFQNNLDPRIAEMVNQAKSLDFQTTDSLLAAIILEANSIKKYWPKYNVRDRDNRSFCYVLINPAIYPTIKVVRERELAKLAKPKAKIFGPYQSATLINQALRLIRTIFPYSTCQPNIGRACFEYQIGLCPGACLGLVSPAKYRQQISHIVWLLKGEREKLIKKLIKENPPQAKALKHLQEVSLLMREENISHPVLNRVEGYDLSHLSGQESYGSMVVFKNGQPAKDDYRLFKLKNTPASDDLRGLCEVLGRRARHLEWGKPDLILIDGGLPQINFVYQFFQAQNIDWPMVGLSKYGHDRLVFSPNTSLIQKKKINEQRELLLAVRDEAHRFVNNAGRRARRYR